jgi:hypothetical protein
VKAAVAAAVGLLVPLLARPAAYDVEARTEAQLQGIRRFTADPGRFQILERPRIVQLLDLAGFELVTGEDAGLAVLLRLDEDFGISEAEVSGLDGVRRARLQVLTGRVYWKDLARGRLDLEAGRIAAQGPVSFLSFDGARATVRPLRWLSLGAFGGLRVQAASWLGSATFAPDGVRESDERRLAGRTRIPCPVPDRLCADPTLDDPAPMVGGRIAVAELPGGFASAAEVEYRRVWRARGVIEERLGGGLRYRVGPLSALVAGDYDLYLLRLAVLRASLRWAVLEWLALAVEGSHWQESFSADSIFNLFDTAPWREARLRADVAPPAASWRAYLAGGLSHVSPTAFGQATFGDRGGTAPEAALGASWESGATALLADATWRDGVQGRSAWAAATARQTFGRWLTLDGRLTLASLGDPVVAANGGTFASAAAIVSGRLERRAVLALMLEDSRRSGRNDFRASVFLTLGADWDTRVR